MATVGLFLTVSCAATMLGNTGEATRSMRNLTGLHSGKQTGTRFSIQNVLLERVRNKLAKNQ